MNLPPSNRSTSAHGLQLHSPAPMPSGTPLTLSTSTTAADAFATTPTISTAVNSNDPNLRRQPTPLPSRVPVETTKISKTQDSNNPTWKMLNQYRVIRLLGRGTHGTVKYGEDMSKEDPHAPDYAVAIKIIKRMPNRRKLPRADGRDRTNTALTRIRYEVAVMKRCNHDHIVRLIEVIDDPRSQAVFLIMEYLEGGEIKWRGHDGPLLSLEQIRRIIRDVLLGLEYLHYMGIIHRDIKPANMLWTKGRARVKLTDFGVAHFSKPLNPHLGKGDSAYEDDDSHLHKTEGTPAFYAPEQAYNQNGLPVPTFPPGKRPPGVKGDQIYPMTKALDVWAFGVSIYCFLFGKPPYWGLNVYALCKEIVESEYEVPTYATADQIPVNSDDPNMQQALALMRGMMTKPVYLRMTLAQAKVSPWLTGDLEDPAAWLRETNPEAKDSIMISETEPASALIPKNHTTRVPSILKALFIRNQKENSRQQKRVDARSIRGQSQVSLEQSTHRPLPGPRSIYRPSADQPASPIDYYQSQSAASSPTGISHFGESYFGRAASAISNSKAGELKRMMSSLLRRSKKSTSAEAIMATPAPITPITRATRDMSASSSPPPVTNFPHRPPPVPTTDEQELEPHLITYSSEEPDDDDEGDVPLLGFGGYETYNLGSGDASPPSEASRSFAALANASGRRFSTTTSDPLEAPQRVYSPRYAQHTHENRDEFTTDTITSTPSSPKNETVYIMGASSAPQPFSQTGTHVMRGRALSGVTSDGDSDDEDDEPTTLQMNVHRSRVRQ